MSVNDPISDMLTRIRNAGMARKAEVVMPSTKVLVAIADVLKAEGYIDDFQVIEKLPQNNIKLTLRYGADKKHSIREIKRVSKPGLRVYAGKEAIPRVKSGLGIAIVSTPEGVLTGYEARRRGIGGEVLCTVFYP
jgi:small subunit ribosomal protein S8